MRRVFSRGYAGQARVAEQAKKVGECGGGERGMEQVTGDVYHVLLNQPLLCLPHRVEEHINEGRLNC